MQAPPAYGSYDQPPQPGFGYPPQPGYPAQPGYPPAQPGYPSQPGYPAQPGGYPAYPGQPAITQPPGGCYPGGQPQTIVVHEKQRKDDDCLRNCCLCTLCMALCCWCCND